MDILAIINDDPREIGALESLEIAIHVGTTTEALLRGVFTTTTALSGTLHIYLLGRVERVKDAQQTLATDLDPSMDESCLLTTGLTLQQHGNYTVVSIPYDTRRSPGPSVSFAVHLETSSHVWSNGVFTFSIYVGAAQVGDELVRAGVWDRLVPIRVLSVWLLFPRSVHAVSSSPQAIVGLRSTVERLRRALLADFELDEYGILGWKATRLSLANPLRITTRLATPSAERERAVPLEEPRRRAALEAELREYQEQVSLLQSEIAESQRQRRRSSCLPKLAICLALLLILATAFLLLLSGSR